MGLYQHVPTISINIHHLGFDSRCQKKDSCCNQHQLGLSTDQNGIEHCCTCIILSSLSRYPTAWPHLSLETYWNYIGVQCAAHIPDMDLRLDGHSSICHHLCPFTGETMINQCILGMFWGASFWTKPPPSFLVSVAAIRNSLSSEHHASPVKQGQFPLINYLNC